MAPVLVVTAVAAEADAVIAHLGVATPHRIGPYPARRTAHAVVLAAGIGPAAAAAATATALATEAHPAVVNMGIAGGFRGRLGVGDAVVAATITAADLGADSPQGYLPLGPPRVHPPAAGVAELARRCQVPAGEILTLSCMTGTEERAAELRQRHPDALAEAMEGAGVATAAAAFAVPCYEIRAVSNLVGLRQRETWDIPGALATLGRVAAAALGAAWPHPPAP